MPYGDHNNIDILNVPVNKSFDVFKLEDNFVTYENKSIKALSNLKIYIKGLAVVFLCETVDVD